MRLIICRLCVSSYADYAAHHMPIVRLMRLVLPYGSTGMDQVCSLAFDLETGMRVVSVYYIYWFTLFLYMCTRRDDGRWEYGLLVGGVLRM